MPKAKITISLKPTVLDAQGAVVKNALHSLGFDSVEDVRIGKYVEVDVPPGVEEPQVREMCQKLLANPIIEQYSIVMSNEG